MHFCGETTVPLQLLGRFLDALQRKYTAETYHLLDNNCNHFSADLTQFLTGKNIPDEISGLPSAVLQSSLGKLIRPLIDNMERIMVGSTNPAASPDTANCGSVLLVNSSQKAKFRVADLPAVMAKVLTLDEGLKDSLTLTAEERAALQMLVQSFVEDVTTDMGVMMGALAALDAVVERWPIECLFPIVDILRVVIGRGGVDCIIR